MDDFADLIGIQFQSTLPVWGATIGMVIVSFPFLFQSTLPVWGATGIEL